MKPDIAAHLALNRRLRALYVAAQRIANEAADGAQVADVKTKAASVKRQLDVVKTRAVHAVSLFRNRAQYVQAFALDDASGVAFQHVALMSPAALRGFIPHVVARFNAGEANAKGFAAAIVSQIEGLDEKSRPMSSARFAELLALPEFDVLSVNARESLALADAISVVSDQLATAGTLSAQGRIAIGLGVKELRPADQLAAEDAAYFMMQEDKPDESAADDAEPGGAGDGDGSNSGGEAGESDAGGDAPENAGPDDQQGKDGGGAEGSGAEGAAVA